MDFPIDFPFKTNYITPGFVKQQMLKLKNNIPKYSTKPYVPQAIINNLNLVNGKLDDRYIKIITPDNAYEKFNIITDFFIEKSRMTCTFKNYLSPLEYWIKYSNNIHNEFKGKSFTMEDIRDYLYMNTKECNLFKITTAAFVYKFFNAEHILDFSAGWGDRLLAACALNINYFGIDPNGNNTSAYTKIIKTIGQINKQTVIKSGSEYLPTSYLNKRTEKYGLFNLIFTSPPYFTYETYALSNQSVITYIDNVVNWTVYFLYITLIKLLKYLSDDGHLVLYIQDVPDMQICSQIILFMLSYYPNIKFRGIISEKLPMLVFQKLEHVDHDVSKYIQLFERHYKKYYDKSQLLFNSNLCSIYEIDIKLHEYEKKFVINDIGNGNIYIRYIFKLLIGQSKNIIVGYGTKKSSITYPISKICHMLGKKYYFVCPTIEYDSFGNEVQFSDYTKRAIDKYGLIIKFVSVDKNKNQLKTLKKFAEKLFENNSFIYQTEASCINHSLMIETVRESLNFVAGIDENYSGRIFLIITSPDFIQCMYKVFKRATFFAVVVDQIPLFDEIDINRTTLINYPKTISEDADILPPDKFKVSKNLDAKVWEFFIRNGKNGDLCFLNSI